jgi:hypothetical protein
MLNEKVTKLNLIENFIEEIDSDKENEKIGSEIVKEALEE